LFIVLTLVAVPAAAPRRTAPIADLLDRATDYVSRFVTEFSTVVASPFNSSFRLFACAPAESQLSCALRARAPPCPRKGLRPPERSSQPVASMNSFLPE